MEKIKIGKIVNAVALRGEVKVYSYSDRKERYEALKEILVEQKKGFTPYEIQNVRYQKNIVILKLRGVDDRNAAEALKERDIYITEADLPELPDDIGEDGQMRLNEAGEVVDPMGDTEAPAQAGAGEPADV